MLLLTFGFLCTAHSLPLLSEFQIDIPLTALSVCLNSFLEYKFGWLSDQNIAKLGSELQHSICTIDIQKGY